MSLLGRIAPIKGAHLAIEAGEIQPIFRDYFEV